MELTTVISANFSKVKNSLDKYSVKYTTSANLSYTNFKINFDSFANLTDSNKVNLLNELNGTSQELYLR